MVVSEMAADVLAGGRPPMRVAGPVRDRDPLTPMLDGPVACNAPGPQANAARMPAGVNDGEVAIGDVVACECRRDGARADDAGGEKDGKAFHGQSPKCTPTEEAATETTRTALTTD